MWDSVLFFLRSQCVGWLFHDSTQLKNLYFGGERAKQVPFPLGKLHHTVENNSIEDSRQASVGILVLMLPALCVGTGDVFSLRLSCALEEGETIKITVKIK